MPGCCTTPARQRTFGAPVLAVCGVSGSGKTTLLEAAIPHLKRLRPPLPRRSHRGIARACGAVSAARCRGVPLSGRYAGRLGARSRFGFGRGTQGYAPAQAVAEQSPWLATADRRERRDRYLSLERRALHTLSAFPEELAAAGIGCNAPCAAGCSSAERAREWAQLFDHPRTLLVPHSTPGVFNASTRAEFQHLAVEAEFLESKAGTPIGPLAATKGEMRNGGF